MYRNLTAKKKNIILFIMSIAVLIALAAGLYWNPRLSIILLLLLCGMVAVWLGARFMLEQPLRILLRDIKNLRQGKIPGPIPSPDAGLAEELTWEFNHLFSAFTQARQEIDRALAAGERREYHTKKDYTHAIKHLEKTANTDKLTGLYNRGPLNQFIETAVEKAITSQRDLACLMIDMDNFKEVNDTYGHATGDRLLIFLGDLLRAFSRERDFASRYGGDEFVLLLSDCSFPDAQNVAERICRIFAQESVHCLPKTQILTSASDKIIPYLSIGLASVLHTHCQTPHQLLDHADKALYRAKQNGRNCVAVSNS